MAKILIEACCGSADDVFEAAAGGADRVELNSALFLGGLTPSIGEMRLAREAGLPIIAMVRPRQGGFCYTDKEYRTMLADAEALLEEGAAGIVFGILHPDGTLDASRLKPLVEIAKAKGREAVFHRAIDVVPDWRAALDTLMELGIDRVLTSGQSANVRDGTETICAMRDYAAGHIQILPGAGITLANIGKILEETGTDQVHVLLDRIEADSSTAHGQHIYYGGALYPREDIFSVIDRAQFSRLRKTVEG